MKCNLVKVSKEFQAEGKTKTIFNYYIVFENGVKLPISLRYYDTEKIKDKEKKESLEKVNFSNSQMLFALADILDNENKNK